MIDVYERLVNGIIVNICVRVVNREESSYAL